MVNKQKRKGHNNLFLRNLISNKLLIFSLFFVLIALYIGFLVRGIQGSVQRISINDSDKLKNIFFGNDPWTILCAKEDLPIVLPSFDIAAQKLGNYVSFGILDCYAKLPSGKTIIERWDLDTSISPIIFTVANHDRPAQVVSNDFHSPKILTAKIESLTRPKPLYASSQMFFDHKCLYQNDCIVVIDSIISKQVYSFAAVTLPKFIQEFKDIYFVQIDPNQFQINFLSNELMDTIGAYDILPKFFHFHNASKTESHVRIFQGTSLTETSLKNWIKDGFGKNKIQENKFELTTKPMLIPSSGIKDNRGQKRNQKKDAKNVEKFFAESQQTKDPENTEKKTIKSDFNQFDEILKYVGDDQNVELTNEKNNNNKKRTSEDDAWDELFQD